MNQRITALKFICRCLAFEKRPEAISNLRKDIRSGRLSWEAVVSIANDHLLSPALWVALKKKDLTVDLPADLCDYLQELHCLSVKRNEYLQAQLVEAVSQLNSVDVVPILLKGAMHLVTDLYGDIGARMMTDIDLLVSHEEADKSLASLYELGYQPQMRDDKCTFGSHRHCPPLFRLGDYAAVEVHTDVLSDFSAEVLPTGIAIAAAEPLEFRGLPMKTLSPTHRVLHNILHSQLMDGNYSKGVLPLRSLHEVTTESVVKRDSLDWLWLKAVMEQHKRDNLWRTYFYMAHRLFNMPLHSVVRSSPYCFIYYLRCCLQIGWEWLDVWGYRVGRFSADNIRSIYGCGDGWVPLNRARLSCATNSVFAYACRIRSTRHN